MLYPLSYWGGAATHQRAAPTGYRDDDDRPRPTVLFNTLQYRCGHMLNRTGWSGGLGAMY